MIGNNIKILGLGPYLYFFKKLKKYIFRKNIFLIQSHNFINFIKYVFSFKKSIFSQHVLHTIAIQVNYITNHTLCLFWNFITWNTQIICWTSNLFFFFLITLTNPVFFGLITINPLVLNFISNQSIRFKIFLFYHPTCISYSI